MQCPKVTSNQAAEIVIKALSGADGVQDASVNVGNGTVTVTYDSMKTAVKNLEFVVAEAGFSAGEIPADRKAQAALPQALR